MVRGWVARKKGATEDKGLLVYEQEVGCSDSGVARAQPWGGLKGKKEAGQGTWGGPESQHGCGSRGSESKYYTSKGSLVVCRVKEGQMPRVAPSHRPEHLGSGYVWEVGQSTAYGVLGGDANMPPAMRWNSRRSRALGLGRGVLGRQQMS